MSDVAAVRVNPGLRPCDLQEIRRLGYGESKDSQSFPVERRGVAGGLRFRVSFRGRTAIVPRAFDGINRRYVHLFQQGVLTPGSRRHPIPMVPRSPTQISLAKP